MQIRWDDEVVETWIRKAMGRLGIDRMPTSNELRRLLPLGNALACRISRTGGLDALADRMGIERSDHASRKGWAWEDWFSEQASERGLLVVKRNRVKSPHDLIVSGFTVDVKVATGAQIANGLQWTWRNERKEHGVDIYALIGLEEGKPPTTFIVPAFDMPLTCATTRRGPKLFGKRALWLERWDLFRSPHE